MSNKLFPSGGMHQIFFFFNNAVHTVLLLSWLLMQNGFPSWGSDNSTAVIFSFLQCMTVSDGLIMLSRHSVGTYQENEFTHNSSRNTRPHLPQLAEPLWTDPGLKSKTGVRELFSIKRKNEDGESMALSLPPKSSQARGKKQQQENNNSNNKNNINNNKTPPYRMPDC